jgi:hypothetical protein
MQVLHSHHTRKSELPGWKLPRAKAGCPAPYHLSWAPWPGLPEQVMVESRKRHESCDMGPQWTGQSEVSQRAMPAIGQKEMGGRIRKVFVKDSGNHSHNGVPESYL